MTERRLHSILGHLQPIATSRSSLSTLKVSSSESGVLQGKVAIVTGAGSQLGIGREAARLFAKEGAAVVCADWDQDGAKKTAQDIVKDFGTKAIALKVDVSCEEDNKRMVEECVSKFGKLDIFFANAGIVGNLVRFKDIDPESFLRTLKINVIGVFLGIKHASRVMIDQGEGGSILCTASVAGLRSGAGATDYSASKAAVINVVQTSAMQLTGTGIRVNAICPGLIYTGMTKTVFDIAKEHGTSHKIGQLNPTGRAGDAKEVANVALFLASDASSYVNGQAVAVCGGLSASLPFVPGRMA